MGKSGWKKDVREGKEIGKEKQKKEMEKRRSLNLTGVEKLKGAIKNC